MNPKYKYMKYILTDIFYVAIIGGIYAFNLKRKSQIQIMFRDNSQHLYSDT